LRQVGEIGIKNGMYYLYADGCVITLDLNTGQEIWNYPAIGGTASNGFFDFDDAGTLYICGHYGPDLAVVDKDGKLLKKIVSFDEDYYWADEIICQQDSVVVNLSYGPDGYKERGYTCVVTLPDFSYEILCIGGVCVQCIKSLDSVGFYAVCVFFEKWVNFPLTIKVPGNQLFHRVYLQNCMVWK